MPASGIVITGGARFNVIPLTLHNSILKPEKTRVNISCKVPAFSAIEARILILQRGHANSASPT